MWHNHLMFMLTLKTNLVLVGDYTSIVMNLLSSGRTEKENVISQLLLVYLVMLDIRTKMQYSLLTF